MIPNYYFFFERKKKQTNWIPLTKKCFVPSLIEIGPVVLKKIFRKISLCFLHVCGYYLPLVNGVAFCLNKFKFPLMKNAFAKFGWNFLNDLWELWFLKARLQCIFTMWLPAPLEKRFGPSFEQRWIPIA